MGEFDELIRAAAREIEALIPPAPAAELGRHERAATSPKEALAGVNALVAERLLGALELAVARLDLRASQAMIADLRAPAGRFWFATGGGQSAAKEAVDFLENLHPGAADVVLARMRDLLPLDLSDATGDEAAIAARHGAAHLAPAVAVSAAVLRAIGTDHATDPATIIGTAIGVTALLLPSIPKPPAYDQALLEKRRATYEFRHSHTHVPVFGHEFLLVEELGLTKADFTVTGLAGAVDTGFAVRTGIAEGQVPVSLQVLRDPPDDVEATRWDEVADISYSAVAGGARLGHGETPPWPGEFRVRVSATGRDDGEERYDLKIWQAPLAEPVVHKKTDQVGHLLRGEPVPPKKIAPEAPYRWLAKMLEPAGTITIATGVDVDDVVDDFEEDGIVLELDDGVIVVESNNYVGSKPEVLERLSSNGKAASYFWNVNRLTKLSFARHGQVVSAREALDQTEFGDDPEVRKALEGLSFTDWRHLDAKGITAVVRFTGAVIPEDDVRTAIEELFSNC
ncbi:DUF6461 domain-containing protein [Lentzea sp. NPDC051213]|uniref:DUF6461 domain-containing protein n=1 Tax=Lentzea sp. NPDC051213 TaxID=3364126 RepID=UPI0037A8736A